MRASNFGVKKMWILFVESLLLGVGLAMDAFSVSLANGLNDPRMKKGRILTVSVTFAVFQALMPLLGWICVHTIVSKFKMFEKFIPFIALGLLAYIGIKMLVEGIKNGECEKTGMCEVKKLTFGALMLQGIATSIDALSVGFVIAEQNIWETLISVLIIAAVTFVICTAGVLIGKKFGDYIAGKANILGGCILIFIGLEIFITSLF